MDKQIEIIPAILTKDKKELESQILALPSDVKTVQIDICDGKFVNNTTLGIEELYDLPPGIKYDLHLMVAEPQFFLPSLKKKNFGRIIIHAEAVDRAQNFANYAKMFGLKLGLSASLETPPETLFDFFGCTDFIQLMAIKPGFQDQPLDPRVIEKALQIRKLGFKGNLAIDGGVNNGNAGSLVKAGANILVVGSYIWENKDKKEAIERLRNAVSF
ncbi:MAG: hypothetical protein Q8N98_01175 [bacterium]|nr:hypothetical protein [bacterium]